LEIKFELHTLGWKFFQDLCLAVSEDRNARSGNADGPQAASSPRKSFCSGPWIENRGHRMRSREVAVAHNRQKLTPPSVDSKKLLTLRSQVVPLIGRLYGDPIFDCCAYDRPKLFQLRVRIPERESERAFLARHAA
jgi:hypothetical protein